MEDEAASQRIQMASRIWKKKVEKCFLGASRRIADGNITALMSVPGPHRACRSHGPSTLITQTEQIDYSSSLIVCVLLTALLSIQPEVWLLSLATHHTTQAWVMSTSSCHPNHPCYPLVLPLMCSSQFQLLNIPWVPVFLRLPADFKINFKFPSQTSDIQCQLISKHPIAVEAWITFVLEIALKPAKFIRVSQRQPW